MADRREPLKPEDGARVVVLESGPRSIVGRVLFFSFLGLLVLIFAGGRALLLIARERRVAVAEDDEGRRHLLTARRLAPEFSGGIDDDQTDQLGGWRIEDPKGEARRGPGFPRAFEIDGGVARLLLDEAILSLDPDEAKPPRRERLSRPGVRAVALSGDTVLVHDEENRRLALLEPAPGGRRRREIARLESGQRFIAAALRTAETGTSIALLGREDDALWLEIRAVPPDRAATTVSRRRPGLSSVGGIFAASDDDRHGWILFAKGSRGRLVVELWDDEGEKALGRRELTVGLPVYGGPFIGRASKGAAFGAGSDLIIVRPGRASSGREALSVERESGRLDSPWWGIILLGAIFLPVLVALAFGILRTIMRSRSLVYAGARTGSLIRRLGALAVDVAIAEGLGLLGVLIVGGVVSLDSGLVSGFSLSGSAGAPEDLLGDLARPDALRLAISLLVLVVAGAFSEHRWGRTPGKWLLDLEVIGRSGRPGWGEALQRRVLIVVDLFLFAGFYAIVNPAHQRVGDVAADTVVIASPRNRRTFVSVITSEQDEGATAPDEEGDVH